MIPFSIWDKRKRSDFSFKKTKRNGDIFLLSWPCRAEYSLLSLTVTSGHKRRVPFLVWGFLCWEKNPGRQITARRTPAEQAATSQSKILLVSFHVCFRNSLLYSIFPFFFLCLWKVTVLAFIHLFYLHTFPMSATEFLFAYFFDVCHRIFVCTLHASYLCVLSFNFNIKDTPTS